MKKLIILFTVLLAVAGCTETEDQAVTADPTPSMTELAEANPSYWGYIDYLWAENGDSFSDDGFAAYLADWIVEADAILHQYKLLMYLSKLMKTLMAFGL